MTYIGLGYKIRTRRKLEYIFSLGYKTQSTTELQNQWGTGPEPILIERRRTYRGMVWQWALSF